MKLFWTKKTIILLGFEAYKYDINNKIIINNKKYTIINKIKDLHGVYKLIIIREI